MHSPSKLTVFWHSSLGRLLSTQPKAGNRPGNTHAKLFTTFLQEAPNSAGLLDRCWQAAGFTPASFSSTIPVASGVPRISLACHSLPPNSRDSLRSLSIPAREVCTAARESYLLDFPMLSAAFLPSRFKYVDSISWNWAGVFKNKASIFLP